MVMKNWDPLVFFPALAMERRPGLVCFSLKFSSGWEGTFRRQSEPSILMYHRWGISAQRTSELLAVDGLSTSSVAYRTVG